MERCSMTVFEPNAIFIQLGLIFRGGAALVILKIQVILVM